MYQCDQCNREFATAQSRDQHKRDKHGRAKPQGMTKEGAKAVMSDMDDLPDGAWWAMANDLGLDADDFIEEG